MTIRFPLPPFPPPLPFLSPTPLNYYNYNYNLRRRHNNAVAHNTSVSCIVIELFTCFSPVYLSYYFIRRVRFRVLSTAPSLSATTVAVVLAEPAAGNRPTGAIGFFDVLFLC